MPVPRLSHIQSDPLNIGKQNMRIDSEMFRSFRAGEYGDGAVVRLYGWERDTISLGRFQGSELLEVPGVDVVTRPTGGRAVFHTSDEVTYLVVGGPRAGFSPVLQGSYRSVLQMISGALGRLGIQSEIADSSSYHHRSDCFGSSTASDLVVEGRKICGSAQRRICDEFMQHGSILVTNAQCRAQIVVGKDREPSNITSIEDLIGPVSREDVIGVIYDEVHCRWSPCGL